MSQRLWGVVIGGSGGVIGSALTLVGPNPVLVKVFGFCCLFVSLVALNVGWYMLTRPGVGGNGEIGE